MIERRDVVVVGAGHAGLLASQRLAQLGVPHVVLEANRIGDSWRSQRWDSFAMNTPTWMNRLPDDGDDDQPQDGFLLRDTWVARLDAWVARHALPVREGVRVEQLRRTTDGSFGVVTDAPDLGTLRTRAVIVASGMQRVGRVPTHTGDVPPGIVALHSAAYRRPRDLPPGGVLVVGCAQTGGQIAEELLLDDRRVVIAASAVARQRRRYRGRDALEWMRISGLLDQSVDALPDPRMRFRPPPIISGVGRYGHTLSLQGLAARGAVLTGRLEGFEGGAALFADDLAASIRMGDKVSAELCAAFDRAIEAQGIDAPPAEPVDSDPDDVPEEDPDALAGRAPRTLDLAAEGITSIVWSTGFGPDVAWIDPSLLEPYGGVPLSGSSPSVPGLWFLGVPWQSTRASAVVWGTGRDVDTATAALVEHLAS